MAGTAFGSFAFGIASTYMAPVCQLVCNLVGFAGPAFRTNRVLQAQLAYSLHHPVVRAVKKRHDRHIEADGPQPIR